MLFGAVTSVNTVQQQSENAEAEGLLAPPTEAAGSAVRKGSSGRANGTKRLDPPKRSLSLSLSVILPVVLSIPYPPCVNPRSFILIRFPLSPQSRGGAPDGNSALVAFAPQASLDSNKNRSSADHNAIETEFAFSRKLEVRQCGNRRRRLPRGQTWRNHTTPSPKGLEKQEDTGTK